MISGPAVSSKPESFKGISNTFKSEARAFKQKSSDIVDRAQAHHIIPQQYKGPQDWRNIHPVKVGDHQRLIHGSSSELYDILKRLPNGIGES